MVKGITKRAVVVKPNGSQLFEQAIFIVAESAIGVMSQQDMLAEATRIAGGYSPRGRHKRMMKPCVFFAAGALLTSGIWGMALLFL